MTDLPKGWKPRWSPDQDVEIRRIAGKILREQTKGAIDLTRESDPLIDMPLISALAGVRKATPAQWIQRSKSGIMIPAFPEPADTRYADKPQWRAISQVIDWLWPRRWPPGSATRRETYGNPKAKQAAAKGITIRDGIAYDSEGNALGRVLGDLAA